jgi:hypothetical protein
MKTKLILFCLLSGFIYSACEDDTISKVGTGILPGEDKIDIYDDTIIITAKTIQVDSIYAKTINGFLGELYDPSYGTVKAGYVCQFYPSYGFVNLDSIVNNEIDSIFLNVYYTYQGDSLAPMELSVYQVNKPLDKHYYTNVDPASFCNMNEPIARYSYTARNLNIPDSTLQANGYSHMLSVPLRKELGQAFLEEAKKPLPNIYSSVQNFTDFFKGTYLTTTFGTGSLLYVDATEISIYYSTKAVVKDSNDADSAIIRRNAAFFPVTKEVIQLNNIKGANTASLLAPGGGDKTYIKSPDGIFTELTIPIRDIVSRIGKKKFNSVKLSLNTFPKDDWEYAFNVPGSGYLSNSTSSLKAQLLLIEPDSVKNFFELQQVANSVTSFTTAFNTSSLTYDFYNIANVIQNAIDKTPSGQEPTDLRLWLIPVITAYSSQQSYTGAAQEIDYSTSHYLWPSGVTLKTGGDNLKVRIIASDISNK